MVFFMASLFILDALIVLIACSLRIKNDQRLGGDIASGCLVRTQLQFHPCVPHRRIRSGKRFCSIFGRWSGYTVNNDVNELNHKNVSHMPIYKQLFNTLMILFMQFSFILIIFINMITCDPVTPYKWECTYINSNEII